MPHVMRLRDPKPDSPCCSRSFMDHVWVGTESDMQHGINYAQRRATENRALFGATDEELGQFLLTRQLPTSALQVDPPIKWRTVGKPWRRVPGEGRS